MAKVKSQRYEKITNPDILIDATNATAGRLASYVAKQALLGKSIVIVNCNHAIITGRRSSIINDFKEKRSRGGSSPHGPFYPKSPERIIKRLIRGMVPHRHYRGLNAMKKIMCYNSVPAEFHSAKKILAGKEKKTTILSLHDLSKEI